MELQDWRFVAASTAGTSHSKTLTPCQDSHVIQLVERRQTVIVMIASDGAGSAVHSDVGSNLACRELFDNILLYLDDNNCVADISRELVLSWLENVAVAIEHEADFQGKSSRDFACTLLAAIVSDTHAAFLQVGDGAIVIRPRGDDWCHVFWPQHGEFINTTVFITDPSALSKFEFSVGAEIVDEVAAFTDGIEALVLQYSTQSVHSPFFDQMFPAVRSLANSGYDKSLSEKLVEYLDSPAICDRTDDDKTLLLASRLVRPPCRALITIDSLQ